MSSTAEKLLQRHHKLTHSEMMKVVSHVQREQGEWWLNTLMMEGCEVPFRYRRKTRYKSLQGQRVNLTYYPYNESVAGMMLEVMRVVRVRVA